MFHFENIKSNDDNKKILHIAKISAIIVQK